MKTCRKILILCPFPKNVSAVQRLKYEQYLANWEDNNFHITVSPFMDMKMWNVLYKKGFFIRKVIGTLRAYFNRIIILTKISNFDIVYIVLWVTPIGSSFFELITRMLSKKIIFDIDDFLILEKDNNINFFVKFLKSTKKTLFLIKYADHVITSSPFLNSYCLSLNKKSKSTYITSSINTDYIKPKNYTNFNNNLVTIGWTGTFTSKIYLDTLINVFQRFIQMNRHDIRILHKPIEKRVVFIRR